MAVGIMGVLQNNISLQEKKNKAHGESFLIFSYSPVGVVSVPHSAECIRRPSIQLLGEVKKREPISEVL